VCDISSFRPPSMSIAKISSQIALDLIPKDYLIQDEAMRKEIARSFICTSPTILPRIIPNLKLVVKRIPSQVVQLGSAECLVRDFN